MAPIKIFENYLNLIFFISCEQDSYKKREQCVRYIIHARRRSVVILVLQGNSFREKKRENLEVIEQFQHFPLRRGSVLCEFIAKCFNRSLPRGGGGAQWRWNVVTI